MVGRTLSHYRILERLGAGGMAEVYLALDLDLKRRVALKVLAPDVAADPRRLERFQREAEAVAALNHPNIVTIYSVEEADGIRFITMECVEGEPLDRLIPGGGLAPVRFLEVALAIARAVATAHAHGITHRDLKPANVMVGADGRVRVLDFGLARQEITKAVTDSTVSTRDATSEGTVLGTLPYMSPEQAQGLPVDHRTDVFSLGVMYYELLTGQRPFRGATQAALLTCILRDDPVPVSRLRPQLDGTFDRLLERCLAKDPAGRFADGGELEAALAALELPAGDGAHAGGNGGAAPVPERSVAVLPFRNLSADPENEFFSEGVAEDIINGLAAIEGLQVASRTSSYAFKDRRISVAAIAGRLRVRHVLEGSVRRSGRRVRISVQLVDAGSGCALWSDRFDREIEDIFDVQDEIARRIVDKLCAGFEHPLAARLVRSSTRNVEAYGLYLKGRALLYRRGPDLALAEQVLEQAVMLDPHYGQAWAALAQARAAQAFYGLRSAPDLMTPARDAALRAAECNPEWAESHTVLGVAALLYSRDFATAGRELRLALQMNPHDGVTRCWYGLLFLQFAAGRHEEGLRELERAAREEPLSAYARFMYAWGLATARRFEAAFDSARLAVDLDPSSFAARWLMANVLRWIGRRDESVAAFEALVAASQRAPWAAAGLACAYANAGRPADADALYRELVARRAATYVQPTMLAVAACAAGDVDGAYAFAHEAIAPPDGLFFSLAQHYPDLDRLRADPRFPALLEELELPARW